MPGRCMRRYDGGRDEAQARAGGIMDRQKMADTLMSAWVLVTVGQNGRARRDALS